MAVTDAELQLEIDKETAINIYQWLRVVCSTKLLSISIVLGGPGKVVQIDESLFRHKPKVRRSMVTIKLYIHTVTRHMYIPQNHKGRAPASEVWVFGMVDVSQKPGLGYMEIVHTRDAATLLPIIAAHVAPGTEVHSDEWRAYNRVGSLPGISHSTVNHSLHFVDPSTGTHTQNIESYWNRVKYNMKKMKGCHDHQIPSYLDEFMWRERYGCDSFISFYKILQHIAQQYPVP